VKQVKDKTFRLIMKRILLAIALSVSLLGLPGSLSAADDAAPKPEIKKDAKAKFRPFNGKIKAVDKTAMTLTLEGEKAQTFTVLSETRITKDRKPATFADLAVGDFVGGRARETADGKWEAVTINAGQKAVRPSREKKEEKPKQ
jgi:hypothetical protein